jgi:hypothetical protein
MRSGDSRRTVKKLYQRSTRIHAWLQTFKPARPGKKRGPKNTEYPYLDHGYGVNQSQWGEVGTNIRDTPRNGAGRPPFHE